MGLTSYAGDDFKAVAVKKNYNTAFAVTNDGKLHYITNTTTWMTGATADFEWHEETASPTGTSGNWTWVDCDETSAVAIRGGDVCFRGYGAYRQRGDGLTSNAGTWTKTYDGSTDAAVKVYLGYRVCYMITAGGKIFSCGYRYEGMTGEGTATGTQPTFTDITPSGITVVDVCYGYRSAKFLDSDGDIWHFGDNANQTGGPEINGSGDRWTPENGTDNGDFVDAHLVTGGSGDMFVVLGDDEKVYVIGEGSGRENPYGGNGDERGDYDDSSSLNGVYSPPLMAMGQYSSGDNISYMTKKTGEVTILGLDGANLTGSTTTTGTNQSGVAPFTVLGGSQNVFFCTGNVNRFIVIYQS